MKFVTQNEPEVYAQDGSDTIKGLSIVYGQKVERPGAPVIFEENSFDPTAVEPDTVALFNHESNFPLARESEGTLTVEETEQGLQYEVDLPDSPLGENVAESVRRGTVKGSSAEIRAINDRMEKHQGEETRFIEKWGVIETGPVTFPAFDQSQAKMQMSEYRGGASTEKYGEELGDMLRRWAGEVAGEDENITDVYEEMGEAAGVSANTVQNILSADINCPTLERLDGFADYFAEQLDDSKTSKMEKLLRAAREDGCSYEESMAAARKAGVSIRKLNRGILTENYELVQDQLKRLNSRYFSDNLHSQEAKEQIEDLLEGPIA